MTKKVYKTIIFTFLFFLLSWGEGGLFAQAPNWAWAKGASGGSNNVGGNGTTTDNSGNVYVTGSYSSSTITFGSITLTNAGGAGTSGSNGIDYYIVKYDPLGNVIWAQSTGGLGDDYGRDITSDNSGNIYVIGHFRSTTINFGTNTLTNAGSIDIFIVKYDPSGNVIWAKREGGPFGDTGYGITTDANNNLIITGFYCNQITLGSFTVNNPGFNNSMFVAKYDASGNVLWAKGSVCNAFNSGMKTTTDAFGNVYVTGFYYNSSITFGTTTLLNAGDFDMFIVKYNASGALQWAKKTGGAGAENGYGIKADALGNVYVTGSFNSPTVTFDTDTLSSAGSMGIFLVKYDASGNVLWVKGASGGEGLCLTLDGAGNSYLSGYCGSTITFGSFTLTSTSTNQLFVVKYNSSGNEIWAKGGGSVMGSDFQGITIDGSGNIYVCGGYAYNTTFGTNVLTANSGGIFLAKLGALTVDFEYLDEVKEFHPYPNPSNGIFTFNNSTNIKTIEVFNLSGQLILSQSNAKHINLSGFSKGVYFAKLNGEYVTKLVKE